MAPLVIWGLALTASAAGFGFARNNRALEDQAIAWGAAAYGVLVSSIGLLIDRVTANIVGRLYLLGGALAALGAAGAGYASYGLQTNPGALPGAQYAVVVMLLLFPGLAIPLVLGSFYVPTGQLPSRRWRPVAATAVLAMVVFVGATATRPGPIPEFDLERNPLGIEGLDDTSEAVGGMAILVVLACGLAAIASAIGRARDPDGATRQQLKVVASGSALALIAVFAAEFVVTAPGLHVVALSVVPAAAAIAILRFRLWDVDVLIDRSIVYLAVSAILVGVYVAAVLALGAPFGSRAELGASIIGAGCVAAALSPVRSLVERVAGRFLFGHRHDPYEVIRDLEGRLRSTSSDDALDALAKSVAQSLRLPHVRITLTDGTDGATAGAPRTGEELTVPLSHDGDPIGHLHATARSANERFTTDERRLIGHLALQAGIVLHNSRLATSLQQSNEQLITAREAERQRLRHDLHDTVGPTLAAVLLRVRDAKDALTEDTETPADAQALDLATTSQTSSPSSTSATEDMPSFERARPASANQGIRVDEPNGRWIHHP